MGIEVQPFLPLWWLAVVQVFGLVSAWMLRVHEGSHQQSSWQFVFFISLAMVGLTTLAAALTGPCWCLVSGSTLAVMVLTVVWDFDAGKRVLAR